MPNTKGENMPNTKNLELERKQLVEYMLTTGVVKSNSVKEAFLSVKRELFLPENMRDLAYQDNAQPIGFYQTISQPSTIAIMLEMLQAEKGQKVLEVGSGCGYVTALLSEIVGNSGRVFGIEIIPELVELNKKNLGKIGIKNIEISCQDGGKGWKEKAPFDRILVSAACPFIPKPLFDQLKENGRIVAPVGDTFTQEMQLMKKVKGKRLTENYFLSQFMFVPLQGKHGFKQFEGVV